MVPLEVKDKGEIYSKKMIPFEIKQDITEIGIFIIKA